MSAEIEIAEPVVFKYGKPSGTLSRFVDLFWYWSDHPRPFIRERVLPMGTSELVIRLESWRPSDSGLAGPRSLPTFIERRQKSPLLGIHFKPGGAFPFLGLPFGDLHNNWITLADLWGERRAQRLLELLHEEPTIDDKFRLLERWLTWVAGQPPSHHAAIAFALDEFDKDACLQSSAIVAEKVNLSQRRFIDLFRNEVGLTPKLFCRVQRFRDIVQTIQTMKDLDWVDLALSFGYTDQSHFIHEFRAFSGLRPTEYLPLRTEHAGHVRVPE
jgi:AraC-like DNA-binding protein